MCGDFVFLFNRIKLTSSELYDFVGTSHTFFFALPSNRIVPNRFPLLSVTSYLISKDTSLFLQATFEAPSLTYRAIFCVWLSMDHLLEFT